MPKVVSLTKTYALVKNMLIFLLINVMFVKCWIRKVKIYDILFRKGTLGFFFQLIYFHFS